MRGTLCSPHTLLRCSVAENFAGLLTDEGRGTHRFRVLGLFGMAIRNRTLARCVCVVHCHGLSFHIKAVPHPFGGIVIKMPPYSPVISFVVDHVFVSDRGCRRLSPASRRQKTSILCQPVKYGSSMAAIKTHLPRTSGRTGRTGGRSRSAESGCPGCRSAARPPGPG